MAKLHNKSKKRSPKLKNKPKEGEKKTKWKKEHEELVKAIKMSRLIK